MSNETLYALETEMVLRRMSPASRSSYRRCVKRFLAYHTGELSSIRVDEVRGFLLALLEKEGLGPAQHKMHVAALKFLFKHVVLRPGVAAGLPWPKVPKSLPPVLSREEVGALLKSVSVLKYRVAGAVLYATGLRVSEGCRLEVGDIDAKRMVVHVRHGKGAKDRYVPLPSRLLLALRAYWKIERPARPWLFPNGRGDGPMSKRALQNALQKAGEACGLTKRTSPHVLRYSYATHMLESGMDLATLQGVLGHAALSCTLRYLNISQKQQSRFGSPIDGLGRLDLPGERQE